MLLRVAVLQLLQFSKGYFYALKYFYIYIYINIELNFNFRIHCFELQQLQQLQQILDYI